MRYHLDKIKNKFFQADWYEVYSLIEFLANQNKYRTFKFIKQVNQTLEDERVPYRVVDNLVVPLVSEPETKEIEKVLALEDKYLPAKKHMRKALGLYSKKPEPDYHNSIAESIHAVEAVTRIVQDKDSASLSSMTKDLKIHPAFRLALDKLYAWSSDEKEGIRHSAKPFSGSELRIKEGEARFMLVICSAFVNYIVSRQEE